MSDLKQKHAVIDDERLVEWLALEPDLPPSPQFVDRVMKAIEARPESWWVRIRRFFLTPHQLEWNVAGLATTIAFILCISVGFLMFYDRPDLPIGKDMVTVQFQLYLPDAKHVALAGDFSQWEVKYPLRRQPNGTWVVEIPLSPGEYEYSYVVNNDTWIKDPKAKNYRNDGFGNINTVLIVPPHQSNKAFMRVS